MQKIVLASQSPRRKQLLEWAEVPFEVVVQDTLETYPPNMAVEEIPIYIARQKAIAVREILGKRENKIHPDIILAADTIVVFENRIIGKPTDRQDALAILSLLSGKEHRVITGVVLLYGGNQVSFSDISTVVFHPLTQSQLEFYVDKYKPYDKAGAYAIQEWIGVVGIKSITGDFYNVMGLPVSRVVRELEKMG